MVQLEYYVEGNRLSKNLIVFLQGWPDNHKMWDYIQWEEELKDNLIVFIDFPNTNSKTTHKWGVDFIEIVEGIKQVVDRMGQMEKKTLVAHDWGCFYGYLMDQKYPKYYDQLIMMDIPGIVQLVGILPKIYVLLYQIVLLIAFVVGGRIGAYITKKMSSIFNHRPPYFDSITASRNYPYYYLWRNKLLSLFRLARPYLQNYQPSVPVVYMHGTKKPFTFHGPKWTQFLKTHESSGCEIHAVESGHWFMKKFSKFVTQVIVRRVAKL